MQKNFWTDLYLKKKDENKPIIVLAPMADVTDYVFRNLIAEKSNFGFDKDGNNTSNLDVFWTEFVSVNGLNDFRGRVELVKDLRFDEKKERPIVAQIFGDKVEGFANVTKLLVEMNFDGIDINMGCPDTNVNGQGSGAYMIKVPELAKEIALEIKKELENQNSNIPLTIKTRIGYNHIEWQSWLGEILKVKPQVITIHLRTKKEMSLVPAHWEMAPEIVKWIRENFGTPENGGPIIILNGDVKDVEDANKKYLESGCDGIMIGRGVFGNPWLFNKNIKKPDFAKATTGEEGLLTISDVLLTLVEHTYRFEKELSFKNFAIMKKHFKAYVNGFPGAKELRMKLMEAKDGTEIEKTIKSFLFWNRINNFWKNIFRKNK
jgi:tRNA-dihydrouridine synthase